MSNKVERGPYNASGAPPKSVFRSQISPRPAADPPRTDISTISQKHLPARSGSFWMRSESSGTRGEPSNSGSSVSGPRSNGELTVTFPSEIAELMSVKSKHGAGGEFTPDWAPGKVRLFGFFFGFHVWLKCRKARTTSASDRSSASAGD